MADHELVTWLYNNVPLTGTGEYLFNVDTICNFEEIWDPRHCKAIKQIIDDVFHDIGEEQLNFGSAREIDELFVNKWEDFLEDNELLAMAADNLFQESQLETGHHEISLLAEDSMFENNVSELSTDLGESSIDLSDVSSQLNVSN